MPSFFHYYYPPSERGLVIPVFLIIIITPPSGRGLVIPVFFWWSLAPDLRFCLGQTNTSCKRSVNISNIFSRLASIRQNLHEKQCRKLLAIQWQKTLFDESEEEDASKLWRSEIRCRLYFRWLLDASQIQQWNTSIFDRFALLRQNLCVQSYKEFDGVKTSLPRRC